MNSTAKPPGYLHYRQGEPLTELSRWRQGGGRERILLVAFELSCWWLAEPMRQQLVAVYYLDQAGTLHCAVSDARFEATAPNAKEQFDLWVAAHDLAVFVPGAPLALAPVYIGKPWGREIWFTGVEARGVCRFSDGVHSAPIPWVQAILPPPGAGVSGKPLVLLKILDPLPEAVSGDLYFELHQEKREVYVVTHVDETAWPDGTGGIRFGFDIDRVRQAGSREAFCEAYLGAVRRYERVRREIDALPPGTAPDAEQLQREATLRAAMNAFTHTRELRVGDVVVVPLHMPHSLQHGVRTIEFQTPVYERQILSFAQKVVTQDHWDTEEAVSQMILRPPQEVPFEQLAAGEGVTAERIVDFPDFEVRRLRLDAGSTEDFLCAERYALVMVVEGQLRLGHLLLGAEQAAYLPPAVPVALASSQPPAPLVLLLALPRS